MSERRDYGDIFATPLVRHSVELANTLWGVTVSIVDRDMEPHFPAVAPLQIAELMRELFVRQPFRKELELHLAPLFVSTPDWTGPRWFQPVGGVWQLVTPAGSASGRPALLCVPFVVKEEAEKAELRSLESLIQGLHIPLLEGTADQVPVLSPMARRKLQTHMSTLGRELDQLLTRSTRRSGDQGKPSDRPRSLMSSGASVEALNLDVSALSQDAVPVLICGEVGTGKRTLARATHRLGPRRSHPLFEIDCESTPADEMMRLILGKDWSQGTEPEVARLVGHGTLLLHEVQYLPRRLQQFLLALYEAWDEGGEHRFRIVATTSLSLEALERLGTVRLELIELLRDQTVDVPPLRQRKEDIPLLASDMLLRLRAQGGTYPGGFAKEALKALQSHGWPGNMWELKTEVRAAARRAEKKELIGVDDLSKRVIHVGKDEGGVDDSAPFVTLPEAVETLERSMLMEALGATRWNRSRTAKVLGISRRNLIRKIARYDLDRRKRGLAREATGEFSIDDDLDDTEE